MQTPKHINEIADILSLYDALLIDMCGVLHDGNKVFPGINELLHDLVGSGIEVILFSNSPRLAAESRKQLAKYGVDPDEALICTSGQNFIDSMNERAAQNKRKAPMVILGEDKNPKLAQALQEKAADIVLSVQDAEYMVILDNATDEIEINRHDAAFKQAARAGILAFCPNPDTKAVAGRNISYPQGAFAARYEEMGGMVEYFGKPTSGFYEYAEKMLRPGPQAILAIGDNMDTDILGARNHGIDSLLVLGSGIYRNSSEEKIYKGYEFRPTYSIEILR